ncbi:MAG: metallophosphoesterase family protein [Chloroflexi bacterium]|nr:metallophosphoesterase family protein [Chloroflexota bacterium]
MLADDISLVRISENWRYFKGITEPSNPVTAWTQLDFNDDLWLSGPAAFTANYGSYNEATVLTDFWSSYSSIYFRKKFTVSNPAAITWLILRVDYDDGFVAYLNGQEVARRGLAGDSGTPPAFSATAASHYRKGLEEIDVSAFNNLLVAGENILALQAHNSGPFDYSFCLAPELVANFTRGPFLQSASTNSMLVVWKTFMPASSVVEFGTSAELGWEMAQAELTTNHVVALTNLWPGTTYYYRIKSSAAEQTAASAVASFRTFRTTGPISFIVVGDTGSGTVPQHEVAGVMKNLGADFVLEVGDVIYPFYEAWQEQLRVFSVYGPQMRTTPFFYAIGNHDSYANRVDFFNAFYLPTNRVTSTEHFYSFDHGDAHFAVLNTDLQAGSDYGVGSLQYLWLEADLAATTKPWKFLFFHHVIRGSGPHRRWDDYNFNGILDTAELQNSIGVLAARYGVQVIFTGHDHVYERLNPLNGFHTVITGGGGATLYSLAQRDLGSAQFWPRYHCVKVLLDGDTLQLQAVDNKGEVFDSMSMTRALPPPRRYEAAWHSPVIESKPADDFDGNINNQRFDLAGAPIPTRAGQFSNLGQVYVNNDRDRLYIGLAQVMIYPTNNIFLFIESPRQTGVTNLAGLGNGVIDPDGQGVDGLDFLENLSFTNFVPSIACLLGDEFGDASYRFFARPGLALNVGQGVFMLDAGLSDVWGARLQQFNRSPQYGAVLEEQNADFIEISIPYSALGGLHPGDVIKLGAVVGGSAFHTNLDQQTRQIDSSALGYSLTGSGEGPVILEGVEVQLAADPDPDSDGLSTAEEIRLGTDPFKADTDGDQLPDGWEVQYGLNPLSVLGPDGAGGDPDLDGADNLQELTAGTDPHNARSVFKAMVQSFGNQKLRLEWLAVPGKRYQLEYATNLAAGFHNVPGMIVPVTATSPREAFDEDLSGMEPLPASRFYRVRLVP